MPDTSLILKALEFASGRHKAQVRKGLGRIPYINHPIQVANLLANDAGETDPVLLTAAILHDVIEDTVNSVEEKDELITIISGLFGEEVLLLTLEVTDDKTLEKKERKRNERHEIGESRTDFEENEEARQESLKAVPGTAGHGFSGAENDRGDW